MHQVGPGIEPRWTSSDKYGVGKALSPLSRVWFTLSHGILNEVYFPRVDEACVRDLGFVLTDGTEGGFFSEEKRDCRFEVKLPQDGVPAYELVNSHHGGRYRMRKWIVADPRRDVVMQRIQLETISGEALRLFALLAPHLVNRGAGNTAWLGEYKGQQMLFAEGRGTALALAVDCGWAARSAGFVGSSDGYLDVFKQGRLVNQYDRAADGNVALCGELALPPTGHAMMALGFGRSWAEAAYRARSSLQENFDDMLDRHSVAWKVWQSRLRPLDRKPEGIGHNTYRISTAVIRTHDSPAFPGGLIASLSIPWGASKGDDDLGGYHLVWPRDLVLTAGGLLACGAGGEAIRVLDYLRAIQEADGSWPQNAWLDGTPYWRGIQLDECAFPILLTDLCLREGAMPADRLPEYWPMARAAAAYVLRIGPATGQDRWEENPGYSPFTLAVEVAALVAAADLADRMHEPRAMGEYLRDTADAWNDAIDAWCYATDTPLAREVGVPGYYVRIAGDMLPGAEADLGAPVPVKNRPLEVGSTPAWSMVSPDALALVRFGLRRPDDPRILNTLRVIDHTIRVDLPSGPHWYRYNGDGYGEHDDGSPFNGVGKGRLWPLMTGERAHYLIADDQLEEAGKLLETLEASASPGFMLPEQVWDADDIPQRELFLGRPSGSAMPLVWAHSEHVKLLRSLQDGRVFDMPHQAERRYLKEGRKARVQPWRTTFRPASMQAGRRLRVDLPGRATIRWTGDDWATMHDVPTSDTGLGFHAADLDTAAFQAGSVVEFTWQNADGSWAGSNWRVEVQS